MMNKVKILCSGALVLCAFCLTAAPKIELIVEPQPVRVGEPAQLIIRSNDGERNLPLYNRMPKVKGITWGRGISQSHRTSINILNFKRVQTSIFEAGIGFTVDKPGTYTIPEFHLTHHKEKTSPLTFRAVEAHYQAPSSSRTVSVPAPKDTRKVSGEDEITMDQVLFSEIEIPEKRPFYYLGEEIPLIVNVFAMYGAKVRLSWPQVSFGEKDTAVLADFRKTNRENPNFSGYNEQRITRSGHTYSLYRFSTAFRPIAAGTLEVSAKTNSTLSVPDERRRSRSNDFFDDFFDDFPFSRERQVARNMTAGPLKIKVRKLPPVPDGQYFTGLVGNWNSSVTLSPAPYRVGEPITMKVEFTGTGSPDGLLSRPLNLKGFRVYPPEIEKRASGVELRYVLIPMEVADGKTENLVFGPYSTFDPVSGQYTAQTFRRNLVIEKGTAVVPANAGSYVVETAPSNTIGNVPEPRRTEEVLYLKKTTGKKVSLPLMRSRILTGLITVAAGILFFVIALIIRLTKSSHENDPDYRRRTDARKRKSELLKRISRMNPEEIAGACSGDIASCLADSMGLARGADLNECAEAVRTKSPELAKQLNELAQAAWMPSMNSRFTPEFRSRLVKLLGKMILFAVLLLPVANLEAAPLQKTVITNDAEAMTAYDSGKFEAAGKYYASEISRNHASAEAFYNLGNCFYKLNKLPQALVAYERAVRLNPRDPDMLENLNLVRRKLQLAERYVINTPSDVPPYLRDMLRPDEWYLVCCIGIALLFIGFGLMLLKANKIAVRSLPAIGILCVLVSVAASVSQLRTSYNTNQMIVTEKSLPVYSLPSEQVGKVEMHLKAGEEVTTVERRMDWLRIRSGNAEGWIHSNTVTPLWPESMQ